MSRRCFFADALDGDAARVEGLGAHHLARVLRAQPGQVYELAFAGRVYLACITAVRPQRVDFALVEELPPVAPEREITLGVALFKFDRFEWMIEKATELGLTRLVPLSTRRTDPKLAAAAPARLARWQQVARGAAEQSRRSTWPEITPLHTLTVWLAQRHSGSCVLLSESSVAPVLATVPGPVVMLVGPEGGWATEEAVAAASAGFSDASLGPRILRSETAVLAALARLG